MSATILVVEDDEELNDVLQYNLSRAGYTVLQAWDGATAIETIRRERPALVLLDLMLPGLSGTEVCRLMHESPELSNTAIVVHTAKGAWENFDEVRQYNIAGFFTKPFGTADVLRHVEKVLAARLPS